MAFYDHFTLFYCTFDAELFNFDAQAGASIVTFTRWIGIRTFCLSFFMTVAVTFRLCDSLQFPVYFNVLRCKALYFIWFHSDTKLLLPNWSVTVTHSWCHILKALKDINLMSGNLIRSKIMQFCILVLHETVLLCLCSCRVPGIIIIIVLHFHLDQMVFKI